MRFDFNFKPRLTRDYLLTLNSEEYYMTHYLGIPVKKGLFKNPLRNDHKVTCSFYRNKAGNLIFHDFATNQHLDFINVVMEKYHVNYYQALKIIASDNAPKVNIPIVTFSKSETKIQVQIKDFTKNELDWWKSFGISESTLKKYRVYSCKAVFLNDKLFTIDTPLTFGYYGGKYHGIELWRIYYSQRKEYRFIGNWPTKKIQGFEQLPKKDDLLVITKSMKDVMCLYELGITAIAPNSETQWISKNVLEQLKARFKHIIVFYDNDRPGKYNMAKIRRQYPELKYFFIPNKYGAKDVSDFVKKYGKEYTKLKIYEQNLV